MTLLISAAAFAFWHVMKRRSDSAGSTRTVQTPSAKPYASVALRCAGSACGAALRLRNRKLLAEDAPALPLPNCDRSSCGCCYRKLDDRRTAEGRRTADFGIRQLVFGGRDLRVQEPDRRSD